MDFEGFEGYKKIENKKHLRIQEIYEVLSKYEKDIGEMSYRMNLDDSDILINIKGKYDARIHLDDDNIIIERTIEKGAIDDSADSFENGKSLPLAHADRVIEQIYDLINDYMDDGIIKEEITSAKKVLKLMQQDTATELGASYSVTEYNDERKELYKITQNLLTTSYKATDLNSKREAFTIDYKAFKDNYFKILKPPFEIIELHKKEDSVKTELDGKIGGKTLKVTADFSDNHFLIELDEIVIGAIDCLDALIKRNYRLEINDLKQETIIIAVAIIMDHINFVEKKI